MKYIFLTAVMTALLMTSTFGRTKRESEVRVAIGASKTVRGTPLKIKFVEVLEDSRCPEGDICKSAGNARLRVEVTTSGKTRFTFELDSNGTNAAVAADGYLISLKTLEPYPKSGKPVDRKDLVATFVAAKI